MSDVAYWTVVHGLKGVFSCFCRVETHRTREVPAGPWILACNHLSHFDPPLIAGAFRKPLDFLAMRELFRPAWFGSLLRAANVIPVGRRQADTAALKAAIRRLEKGRIVCVFPEGGLRAGSTSVLGGADLTEGVALLAARAEVPVRPAVIVGSDQLYAGQNWTRRPRILVAVGEPMPPPGKQEKRSGWVQRLGEEMRKVYEEARHRHKLHPHELPHTPQERWKAGR
ncbi:MAG: 1-acyl-sn-glycerol-3-phosphate acyltransferase [Verrucomicrobia bacterium]|nr:1-acyl-sn-glycerol-3-phosphate acyltransferase [Verrucomicrobiota bacterium]